MSHYTISNILKINQVQVLLSILVTPSFINICGSFFLFSFYDRNWKFRPFLFMIKDLRFNIFFHPLLFHNKSSWFSIIHFHDRNSSFNIHKRLTIHLQVDVKNFLQFNFIKWIQVLSDTKIPLYIFVMTFIWSFLLLLLWERILLMLWE